MEKEGKGLRLGKMGTVKCGEGKGWEKGKG